MIINPIIERRAQLKQDKAMNQRLKHVKSQLVIREPLNPVKKTWYNNKKIAELAKWKRIESDNKRLLKRIGEIMAQPHDDAKLMVKDAFTCSVLPLKA